jgi:hypothetical protein
VGLGQAPRARARRSLGAQVLEPVRGGRRRAASRCIIESVLDSSGDDASVQIGRLSRPRSGNSAEPYFRHLPPGRPRCVNELVLGGRSVASMMNVAFCF